MTIFVEAIHIISNIITLCLYNLHLISIHTANPNVYAAKIRLYLKKQQVNKKIFIFFCYLLKITEKVVFLPRLFRRTPAAKWRGGGRCLPFIFLFSSEFYRNCAVCHLCACCSFSGLACFGLIHSFPAYRLYFFSLTCCHTSLFKEVFKIGEGVRRASPFIRVLPLSDHRPCFADNQHH